MYFSCGSDTQCAVLQFRILLDRTSKRVNGKFGLSSFCCSSCLLSSGAKHKHMHASCGFYFVCDHGKRRSATRYNFGCNFFFRGETKVAPKTVPFSNNNIILQFHYMNKVETPVYVLMSPRDVTSDAFPFFQT